MREYDQTKRNEQEYRLPIDRLFPDLTAEQQREAEYFLMQYLEIVYRIYQENEALTISDLNTTV
jgi:hypothetical protein